jgi:hypothetical protein
VLALAVLLVAATAGVWAALENAAPAQPQLIALLPQGALLTIEAKDFAGLLKQWSDSPEKAAWLKSDNYSAFSRSRLFGRLGDAQNEFAQSAGLPPDMSFLNEVAGGESVFAWYDIGKLEFLYITRLPSGSAEKTRLVQMRGKFAARQAGGQTFYVRSQTNPSGGQEGAGQQTPETDGQGPDTAGPDTQSPDTQGGARTVAFATSGDLLLLATREDLMAGALTLLAANSGSAAAANADVQSSLVAQPWFVDARVAAAKEPGALRMTLNLEKIVPSPYFRSYWVQRNVTEMKQFRSAVADLYAEAGDFREERVLLPKTAGDGAASAPDLSVLTALLPQHSGVYRAEAQSDAGLAVEAIDERLLERAAGSFTDTRVAPDADLAVHEVGSASDLETRIDTAPLAHAAQGDALAPLRQALGNAGLQAMMTVSRTGEAVDGMWVPFQSAVVLSAGADWDSAALQNALQQAMATHLTAGGLGLGWKAVQGKQGSYFELSDSRPLELAVRGKLCILADDPGLMREMMGQLHGARGGRDRKPGAAPDGSAQATRIAGFNLAQERGSFARWTGLVDRTNADHSVPQEAAGPDAEGNGSEPSFFSQNMRGLGDVFAALESERMVERRDGALTRQTVTYAWRR